MSVNNYDRRRHGWHDGFKVIKPFMSRGSSIGSSIDYGLTDPNVILTITYHGTGEMGPFVVLEDKITNEETIIDEYTEYIFNEEKICTYLMFLHKSP